ncbi:MAG: hypothetical protein IJ833_03665 [Lachnospiraceae bacterium]|nr:hypothetical protein [Lachnospiraceae bacterium]
MSDSMNEKEMIEKYIDTYTDLQRIKNSPDKDKEIEYQLAIARAKLQSIGISTEDLEMRS